ncbi:ABC transporter permease [bacterium]|nr:ABC transporter permease [bacterium]
MLSYIARRLISTIPVLFGMATITFLLMYVVPGDPVLNMVGERASEETIRNLREELGLDRPIYVRYGRYLWRIVHLDLGRSYYTNCEVSRELVKKFPNTLKLALSAMIIASFLGLMLGVLSSIKKGTWIDYLIMFFAALGISTPVFWLGLLLMLIFSIYLKVLPSSGMGEGLSYLILPAFTLATRSIAFIARITRSSMLEVLGQDYIRTARAKGLKENAVIFKHALKNALIPVVTLIGLDFGSYLSGSVLTETIFGWPGLGRYAVMEGIMKRDLPVVMGTVLFGAFVFVLVNLVVDILYRFLDPRIEYE